MQARPDEEKLASSEKSDRVERLFSYDSSRDLDDLIVDKYQWNTYTRNDKAGLELTAKIKEELDGFQEHIKQLEEKINSILPDHPAEFEKATLKSRQQHFKHKLEMLHYTASQYLCEPVLNLLIDHYKVKTTFHCFKNITSHEYEQPADLKEYTSCVKKLLSSVADINKWNEKRFKPLMEACDISNREKFITCVTLLLEAGADPTIKNKRGICFANLVKLSNDPEFMAILEKCTHAKFKAAMKIALTETQQRKSRTQSHSAFQKEWNEKMELQLMDAPDGTYAIITSGQSLKDLAASPEFGVQYNVIHVEDGKLVSCKLTEKAGGFVVRSGQGCLLYGELAVMEAPSVADLVDRQKEKYLMPFNVYRRENSGVRRWFGSLFNAAPQQTRKPTLFSRISNESLFKCCYHAEFVETLSAYALTPNLIFGVTLGRHFEATARSRACFILVGGEDEVLSQTYFLKRILANHDFGEGHLSFEGQGRDDCCRDIYARRSDLLFEILIKHKYLPEGFKLKGFKDPSPVVNLVAREKNKFIFKPLRPDLEVKAEIATCHDEKASSLQRVARV